MRHVTIFIFLFSMLFSKALIIKANDTPLLESTKSVMVIEDFNTDNTRNPSSREDIILFDWNFESEESAWNADNGWEWTDASAADTSIYSYLSPNTEATYGSVWNLTSPNVTLPELGDGEVMRFKFSLWGDMPDTDGDADDFLDDYYNLSIMDLEALSWHASSAAPAADGNSYWCSDEDIGPDGGYLDEWMQYLDTPATMIGDNASVSANMTWNLESPDGADGAIAGSCTNGWDAANVRVSTDGGISWELLEDPNNPYDFDCGYGWIYNDAAYEAGGALNNVAAGWGGALTNLLGQPIWADASFDLSAYAGQEVIIRFAFGSDPAYSTLDQTDMTGFVVDNIIIEDATGVQYSDNADDSSEANTMVPSGEVWEAMFYDYTDTTRPGGNGWEEYLPGLAFNGNVLHDISHLAGKEIIVKFASRYDDNDDGGAGQGLFIDDFIIYKESSGSFPPPADLMVESGDEEAMLTWQDMNASGTFSYNYTNGTPTNSIQMSEGFTSYAGERFDIVGPSTVNSIDIYNSATTAVTLNLAAFTKQGALFTAEPAFTKEVTLTEPGAWNTIDMSLDGWAFTTGFILAHSFDDVITAALDETAIPSTNSMILYDGGSWGTWQESANNPGSTVSDGEWGIGASITQDGANVTYSVQRDGVQVASVLTSNMYTDTGLMNNTAYAYSVSATYEDGTESDPSELVTVIPQAQTVHQESHDDGTSEAGWAPEGSGQFAAVRYAAHDGGEQIMRYKWFQEGDGGAFYIKVWADENGYPGTELYSGVQVSGNSDGWNEVDLSTENLTVTCDFWVGVKRFSSTSPIGVDADSNSGNSMSSDNGTDWIAVDGNVMVRIFIDEGELGGNVCPTSASVQIIHNSASPTVDIYVDGALAIPGFEYRMATGVLDLPLEFTVGIAAAGDTAIIEEFPFSLMNNRDYVVVATGLLENTITPFDLAASETIFGSMDDNNVGLNVYHGSTDAPAVDILADGAVLVNSLNYSEFSGYVSVPAMDYTIGVAPTGSDPIAEFIAPLSSLGGGSAVVFASGFLSGDDPAFGLFAALEDGTVIELDQGNLSNNDKIIPTSFNISNAYPNPFNPSTTVNIDIPEAGMLKVGVYNLKGQLMSTIMNENVFAGSYSMVWNGSNLTSGLYIMSVNYGNKTYNQKITLVK